MRVVRGWWLVAPMPAREDARMQPAQPQATGAMPTAEPRPMGSEPLASVEAALPPGMQPCPSCGHPMPDLKGGTTSICAICGFKDSCCY
jgi:hypothetical protein